MLEKLFYQYKQVNGIKKLNFEDLKKWEFGRDYDLWWELRREYGYRYFDFLHEINEHITEKSTAEVGKTEFDSIVLPFDTTIISPDKFMYLENRDRLIKAELIVRDENPILYSKTSNKLKIISIKETRIDTYITENPYFPYSILDWNKLHDSGNFNIAVGVYGDIHDKNIKDNLKMLKVLREKIVGNDYKFDYNTDGDIYYAAVASTRKIKKLDTKSR